MVVSMEPNLLRHKPGIHYLLPRWLKREHANLYIGACQLSMYSSTILIASRSTNPLYLDVVPLSRDKLRSFVVPDVAGCQHDHSAVWAR